MTALDQDADSESENTLEHGRRRQRLLEKIARLRRELNLSISEQCRAETLRVIGYFEAILTDVSHETRSE